MQVSSKRDRPTIYVNGRFLSQAITGVQRYALQLIHAVDALLASGEPEVGQWRFVVLAPRDVRLEPTFHRVRLIKVGRLGGHCWEQSELPFYSRDGLLVNLGNTGPLITRNQVVTIHDAAVRAMPGGYSLAFRAWYGVLLPILCRVAKRILTVSDFSKRELMLHYGLPAWKIGVIAEGCDHLRIVRSDRSIFDRLGIRPDNYVLAVSSLNPNKNFGLVVRAIELLPSENIQFVIAGGIDPRVFAGRGATMPEATMPEYAKPIGYVTDQELKALYEGAICLVYPSLYEGFGLPPLEAMACGCPVIVSRAASLPEICGDAAWYCDAYDPQDLAAQIQRLCSSAQSQRSLRDRGLARASRYSWRQCAIEHLQQIDEVIQHTGAGRR